MPARINAPHPTESDFQIPLPDWIASAQPEVPPPAPRPREPEVKLELVPQRPLGAAVLAVVDGLVGALAIVGGLAAVSLGSAILSGLLLYEGVLTPTFMGSAISIAGAALMLFGIYGVALAYGVRRGNRWAWKGSVFLAFLGSGAGIVAAPLSPLTLVAPIVGAGIIVYLTRNGVERFFGTVGDWPTDGVNDVLERMRNRRAQRFVRFTVVEPRHQ